MKTSHPVATSCAAALLVSLCTVSVARATDAGSSSAGDLEATPYRPTASNPADLPVPHHFEWEAGGLAERDRPGERHNSVPYLLKYAFDADFGILVGGESFVSERSDGHLAKGWGDTSVTAKFHHAVSSSTALGLEAGANLPTASNGLGAGHTDFTLNGIVSTEAAGCDVDINVNYTRLGVADAGTSRELMGWAIAASHDIAQKWGLAGELSGTDQRGTRGQAQFLGALSFAAAPTLVFDGGALFGLNRDSPRYGLFAGVTMLVR